MKKVAVSVHANKEFSPKLIRGLENLDFIHVDVMDGKFVETKNINLDVFKTINTNFDLPILAHFMVVDPFEYLDYNLPYIDIFTFHLEIDKNIKEIIDALKDKNIGCGIAINPNTEIKEILPYIKELDLILVMSVYPGWSGQKFLPEIVEKVNKLASYKKMYDFLIEVDGGINVENAKLLKKADILSSSSTILKSRTPNEIINQLKYSDRLY